VGKMVKGLILTDSVGNPRSFPPSEKVDLENTYPYLLRSGYKDILFHQISFGNIKTESLISQAISYFVAWEPDILIVQSGMSDCRPEAFSELEKEIINSLKIFRPLRKYLYHPAVIKFRNKSRVSEEQFQKSLKKMKLIFAKSEIMWLEIITSASGGLHESRPGVLKKIQRFNGIIKEVFDEGYVEIHNEINQANGINSDHLHIRKSGHEVIAELLSSRIDKKIRNTI
jgi:hypothetical protein